MRFTPLFFTHIPKTAGTSFRLAAEDFFGKERILYDYGDKSTVTTDVVKGFVYAGKQDFWGLWRYCEGREIRMLSGHVGANKYSTVMGVANCVTFLRDPFQRLMSEYEHFVRHNNYQKSFADFYRQATMQNRQSKLLHGVPLEAIGSVGLTEQYNESLELINNTYGLGFAMRTDNRATDKVGYQHQVNEQDMAELRRLNAQDVELYERARTLFDTRLGLFRAGQPYAHAMVQEATQQRVMGWAWWAGADKQDAPVPIELLVNDEVVDTVQSLDMRPGLCRLKPPRGGFVGFHFSKKLAIGDKVQCRVAETGQLFPPKPREIA